MVAREQNFSEVLFESDCKELISRHYRFPGAMPVGNLCDSERYQDLGSVRNNWIATNCLSRKLLVVFTGCIPPDLEHIMAKECPS